jgi:hypothetical protein
MARGSHDKAAAIVHFGLILSHPPAYDRREGPQSLVLVVWLQPIPVRGSGSLASPIAMRRLHCHPRHTSDHRIDADTTASLHRVYCHLRKLDIDKQAE